MKKYNNVTVSTSNVAITNSYQNRPEMRMIDSFSISSSLESFKNTVKMGLRSATSKSAFIFSASCGIGKTTFLSYEIADWKKNGFKGNGLIVFVNTLAEIDSYVSHAGLDKEDYAVETGNPIYTRYGSGRNAAGRVPVLFATHSKARRKSAEYGGFEAIPCFHYHGKPRALRVWDEALNAVECASFSFDDLMGLASAYKRLPKADTKVFRDLALSVGKPVAGAVVHIPVEIRAVGDSALKAGLKVSEQARQTLDALIKLAGSKAHLRGSDEKGWHLIGTGLPLPADIAPVIVLDASARLTGRYEDWSPYGIDVVHLPPATLDYGQLDIRWWNRAAGKTAMRDAAGRGLIFEQIAVLINSKPEDSFAIVMAREFCGFDKAGKVILPDALASLIDDPSRVGITNWGRHFGINDFKDAPNIIIVGAFEYDEPAYEALALGLSNDPTGNVSSEERRVQKHAEFISNLYQAVCRCRVRNRKGGMAAQATAYLIMKDTDERRALIRKAFTGCTIEAWEPVPKAKQSKADKVVALVVTMIEDRATVMTWPFVSFGEVIKASESKSRSYLTKTVGSPRFKDKLAEQGIMMRGRQFVRYSTMELVA
jgi:hypothetical protein